MIKRSKTADASTVKVTFVLTADEVDQPVSVVGDFNAWDPMVHPLKKRSNGTRSVSVELATGRSHRFKYLVGDGSWRLESDADTVDNGSGDLDSVLVL